MSQITKWLIVGVFLLAAMSFMAGCGSSTPNSQAPFDAEAQQHPAGWLPAGHKTAALADQNVCAECHGSDYLGGVSKVSCTKCHLGGVDSVHPLDWGVDVIQVATKHGAYVAALGNSSCSNAFCHGTDLGGITNSGPSCTLCHLGGVASFHPTDWGSQAVTKHSGYVAINGNTSCANAACHGADLKGVTGSGPSCESCHLGDETSAHPLSWGTSALNIKLNHAATAASSSSGCSNINCHGADLSGVSTGGPACSACHTNGSYPFMATGCTSCHGKPPSGTIAPNRSGAHTAHNALPPVTDVCDTCHSNAGTGTPKHDNGTVDEQFMAAYNAKSGTAARNNDGTCSNVSCHGGQTTPVWLTGTIDVNHCDPNGTCSCTLCHAYGTAQYNSFNSGHHNYHVNTPQHFVCTACHDVTKLAQVHFTTLATLATEGAASTLGGLVSNYTGTIGTCTNSCHATRLWSNPSTTQP